MTTREVAEKICDMFELSSLYISDIEQVITEALKEARRSGMVDATKAFMESSDTCKKAKKEAYLDAAKIADEVHKGDHSAFTCCAIAEKIRQKANEL